MMMSFQLLRVLPVVLMASFLVFSVSKLLSNGLATGVFPSEAFRVTTTRILNMYFAISGGYITTAKVKPAEQQVYIYSSIQLQ